MTFKEEVLKHVVNPRCGCTKCFIKGVMEEQNGTFEDVIASLEALSELGMVIVCKDADGNITDIIRNVSKKESKKLSTMSDEDLIKRLNDE